MLKPDLWSGHHLRHAHNNITWAVAKAMAVTDSSFGLISLFIISIDLWVQKRSRNRHNFNFSRSYLSSGKGDRLHRLKKYIYLVEKLRRVPKKEKKNGKIDEVISHECVTNLSGVTR